MADFSKLKPALVLRRMPQNGKNSSEDINDFIEQSIHDVAGVYNFINSVVIPTFNGLGKTGTWNDVDPITNGLDGTTLMVDRDYTDTSSPYFYHSGKSRPRTVFETLLVVVSDLNKAFIGINEVKARLGTTDEDTTVPTSQATLSEIETKVNFLNSLVSQIRNANASYLNATQIATQIADLTIDPSSYHIINADVDSDVGIAPTKISGVDLTVPTTYASFPATYDMKDTVLRVKEWIEDLTGETFINYISGNTTMGTTHAHLSGYGTGTVTATNVHGLDVADLTDASNLLAYPQLIASIQFHPSGIVAATNGGGCAYVPNSVTATKVSLTCLNPSGTYLGAVAYKRRAGANTVLASGLLLSSTPIPGYTTVTISVALLADDLIFVSGIVGSGIEGMLQVFGHV